MGRMFGSYDSDELDRPDLNKCPDCGCYFATDECPLCGKICPEEMRAGKRAAVKKKKKKSDGYSGRVTFIPWYHTWLAMILISFIMPIAGVVLFFTSPYSRKVKIIVASLVIAWQVLLPVILSVGIPMLTDLLAGSPVNDDISRAEYVEMCEGMTADDFYRHSVETGLYVTMDLSVVEQLPSSWFGDSEDTVYYRCRSADTRTEVVLRDCVLEDRQVLRVGDMIRVWGESAGMTSFYPSYDRSENLPCLNMAYCDLIG